MDRRRIATFIGLGLVGAAIFRELQRPPAQRTWHGRLGGVIPYDFRPPTWERVQARIWNPTDSRLLTPHPFGVGWGINWCQVQEQLRAALAA